MSGGAPRACVVGWPVAHSRSPIIHAHWLATHGIAGTYEKVPVEPKDLAAFVASMRSGAYVGANVTIPHKEAMAALCDRLTPAAARLNSVNTLWFEDERLVGDTTDGIGFLGALDQELPGWDDAKDLAVVVGAGGAARPIVDALLQRGFADVTITSRTDTRAEALADQLGCSWGPFDYVEAVLRATDFFVNATPAGMQGEAPLGFDIGELPAHAIVDDIVYVPSDTPLLVEARARGLRAIGGLGMLLHQAAPGFERWFGVRPEVTPELYALVAADIAES